MKRLDFVILVNLTNFLRSLNRSFNKRVISSMYTTSPNTKYCVQLTGGCLEGMSISQLELILVECSVAIPSFLQKNKMERR